MARVKILDQAHGPSWAMYHGDAAEALTALPADSCDLAVFSPPFQALYVYSPTERDLGNCRTPAEFFHHLGFITHELFRVMKSGRVVAVHCAQITAQKVLDGWIGLKDFRGQLIEHYGQHGFYLHREVCITLEFTLANDGDSLDDPTQEWEGEHEVVELGELEVISVIDDPETPENPLVFDPMRLTDGIEPSDDAILAARPKAYASRSSGRHLVEVEHERRVVRQDPLDLLVGRIRLDPDEALHLPGPLVHVEPHQRELLGVRDLGGVEVANLAPAAQLALAGRRACCAPTGCCRAETAGRSCRRSRRG